MFGFVEQFARKFGLPDGKQDVLMEDPKFASFRLHFLKEELTELEEAVAGHDRVKAFDAMLDLAYVLYGTAMAMGIDEDQWEEGFYQVHRCNMKKVPVNSAEDSKRGHALDLKKPDGWIGPETELARILREKDTSLSDGMS